MSGVIKSGVFLFLLIAFSNCKQEDIDPSVIINVDADFYIDMFEDISNGENTFNLTIKSIQNQECLNSIIDFTLDTVGAENQIVLSINDIVEPETCIPGSAPAFSTVPLDHLKEEGYKIEINLKDVIVNTGSLTVNSDYYFLRMNTENGFKQLHQILHKIPKKAIWGYVGYEEESGKTEAENFIKDLDNIATNITNAGYDIGYYGYFTINEDRSVVLTEKVENNLSNTFLFQYEGDNQAIIDLVNEYCNANSGFSFHVFNGEGEEMKCQ